MRHNIFKTFKRGLTVVRGLGNFVFMKNHLVPVKSWKPVCKRRNSITLKKGHSIQVIINPTLQKCEHSPVVVKTTQIVFAPAPSRQTQSAVWTSTVAIIPTQYHEPPPNARPQYACGRPLSHEQCKEGKTQQNSETRVFLRVHPFLSMDEQCPLCCFGVSAHLCVVLVSAANNLLFAFRKTLTKPIVGKAVRVPTHAEQHK
jgi:hypothetical protein